MRSVWLALGLAACGDVNVVPDALVPDAYQHDAPNEPMCAAGEMSCNGLCADFMTSETYCGNCETSCAPNQGCVAGACVPNFTNCARIKEVDPASADGLYTNPNNGVSFYCAFTISTQFEFVVNPYTVPVAGYSVSRAADFADMHFVSAFIALYNKDVGFKAATTFTTTNCCMGPAAGARYLFGAQQLNTSVGTTLVCNSQITVNQFVSFGRGGANYGMALPSDYFAQFPVTEGTNCLDGANAAFWVKKTTF